MRHRLPCPEYDRLRGSPAVCSTNAPPAMVLMVTRLGYMARSTSNALTIRAANAARVPNACGERSINNAHPAGHDTTGRTRVPIFPRERAGKGWRASVLLGPSGYLTRLSFRCRDQKIDELLQRHANPPPQPGCGAIDVRQNTVAVECA